jgi:GntR family transcriptional regulator
VPGRSGGTFVIEPKIDCDLTGLAGFTEQLRRANLAAGAEVIEAATVGASRAVSVALGIGRDEPVHEIVRVRTVDTTPLALEHSFFPAAVFPDLLDRRLTGSLYEVLRDDYAREPISATEYLEPALPDEAEAKLLQLDAGQPAMLIERTAFTAVGLPVEYARDLFRSDRMRISVRSGLS